ncbi:MAG TPA: FAD-linked oxidase C-terminal domain-containing protein, partial [Chloroflexota bacterium]|nr:FAD-linked oxidase C-terminal domain-containing protein [Chloroflexota bacterium]
MIGNNSCGPHSLLSDRSGRMVDHVEELEIVTYDGLRMRVGRTDEVELDRIIGQGGRRGAIYAKLKRLRDQYAGRIRQRYPKIPRLVSGYALDQLLPENGFNVAAALVGTEGTCVTVLEAVTRLVHYPKEKVLVLLTYQDVYRAGDHIPDVLQANPMALEGIDSRFISDLKKKGLHLDGINLFPHAGDGAYLLAEIGGDTHQEAVDRARELIERMRRVPNAPDVKLVEEPAAQEKVWAVRESGLGATAHVPGQPENHEGWEDSAVPPERVGDYMRDLRKVFEHHGYEGTFYGHIGQGCLHTRVNFDFRTRDGIGNYRRFMEEATDLVVRYGGSFSGEHGDGQSRAEFLPKMFGEDLVQAFREFKGIWDPAGKMNPGKVVDPYRVTDNLRQGTDYAPPTVQTHFQYPDDKHSFQEASLRCVGVGKCRATSGHTMCPSFQVTLEEKHTTRGRARLLFEMMQGETFADGWRSEEVHEALDLCLACKGCKGDCPVNVDMATYKAEFLSHYYAGRLRPRSGYSMGLIHWWARLASLMPGVANAMTHTPGLSHLAKMAAGVAQPREMPRFAPYTFKQWFRDRQGTRHRAASRSRVILWADTFNDHFFPEVPQAAVEVLDAAGFDVIVPEASLCCGRPLYDYGWLDQAKALLKEILTTLKSEIAAGTPIVGLEPSCVAVFRDELTNLFPHDQDAARLSQQTFTLGEFLMTRAEDYQPPKLTRKAVFHGHCHQKAIMGVDWD